MNSILSGISSYFSKSLILGTSLPVVIFVIFLWLLATPLFPLDWPFFRPLEALDTQWKVVAVSFLTIVLSGFLYNLNAPLIRLYEGYPWQNLWIGRVRKKHYQRQLRILDAQWYGMRIIESILYNKTGTKEEKELRIKPVANKRRNIGVRLNTDFPNDEKLVLPTRLGNVIRCFERYADIQYQIESVILWPRLVAKLDKEYSAEIDGAKTSFDFMLNCSALSGLMAALMLVVGLIYPTPLVSLTSALIWGSEIILFWVAAFFFYRLSIDRAKAWGNTVRGAFDLYRWDLLKQLGYTRLPQTLEEERALWFNISQRMGFGETPELPPAEYSPRTTFVEARPKYIIPDLELLRGIEVPEESGELIIHLRLKNGGGRSAEKIFLTDTLPEDFRYRWDSVTLNNPSDSAHKVSVYGINPYRFSVGNLEKDKELVLTYRGLSTKKEAKPKKEEVVKPSEQRLAVDFRWMKANTPDENKGA